MMLQVDLGYEIQVVGIAIQGQHEVANFVTEFFISYSSDMDTWTTHSDIEPGGQTTVSASFKSYYTDYYECIKFGGAI